MADKRKRKPSSNEKVGYGHPPETGRFRKGHSGNPKGRPKGSQRAIILLSKALGEKVVINENGLRKKVTKYQAATMQVANKAASGDLPAYRYLNEMLREADANENASGAQQPELGELDQEVIEGIRQRILREEEEEGK